MKKIVVVLLINSILLACVNDVERIPMECFVYDSITKKPLNDVNIFQILDGKKTHITTTSESGQFKVKGLSRLTFGMEVHKLSNLFFLEKEGYKIDTIETYGGKNDFYKKDSLFLKPN
ncbi:hypothetical protein LUD75_18910 [Epilithonimonas sp. JDS]|uniref:hypothetical protein n=1 Tax=Epilithonimonas sp. JDS TaxID=2902797 RepID=UPI001E601E8D|nr:hypothetical protein [Epilithonimonas sp. JDS]MCD9856802.1 hypothetical protein [Epilithonimonas sp. JDS]